MLCWLLLVWSPVIKLLLWRGWSSCPLLSVSSHQQSVEHVTLLDFFLYMLTSTLSTLSYMYPMVSNVNTHIRVFLLAGIVGFDQHRSRPKNVHILTCPRNGIYTVWKKVWTWCLLNVKQLFNSLSSLSFLFYFLSYLSACADILLEEMLVCSTVGDLVVHIRWSAVLHLNFQICIRSSQYLRFNNAAVFCDLTSASSPAAPKYLVYVHLATVP